MAELREVEAEVEVGVEVEAEVQIRVEDEDKCLTNIAKPEINNFRRSNLGLVFKASHTGRRYHRLARV